jgi:hypothetical protein
MAHRPQPFVGFGKQSVIETPGRFQVSPEGLFGTPIHLEVATPAESSVSLFASSLSNHLL